jgi:endonuclease-3
MSGTYVLLVSLDRDADLSVGALGRRSLPAGAYAYVGSALGRGGFARVARHGRVAAGEHDVRHWHVDHLLGHPAASLAGVVAAPDVDRECVTAAALPEGPVPGFGASDCRCRSHLARFDGVGAARRAAAAALRDG